MARTRRRTKEQMTRDGTRDVLGENACMCNFRTIIIVRKGQTTNMKCPIKKLLVRKEKKTDVPACIELKSGNRRSTWRHTTYLKHGIIESLVY